MQRIKYAPRTPRRSKGDAVPVIQANARGAPLTAFLRALDAIPMLCFFELSTSKPLLLGNVPFTVDVAPSWNLVIEAVRWHTQNPQQ